MKRLLAAALISFVPGTVIAQVTELPGDAIDGLVRVTLAATAKEKCPGAVLDEAKFQLAMLNIMTELAGDGIDPVAAVKFLETENGKAIFASREAELRARHGVDSEGDDALCAAIAAEIGSDPDLSEMVMMP